MEIKTVGDLQRLLTRFNPDLPILKSDQISYAYFEIPFERKFEYRVKPFPITYLPQGKPLVEAFIDADANEPGSFNAIIL
jgi:hypothetical protein